MSISNNEFELLVWDKFAFEGMVKIYTEGDGSCFFHAIISSFYTPYITGHVNTVPFNRKKYIRNLRYDLSKQLKNYYHKLSRGEFENLSKAKGMESFSLEEMEKELNSNSPVDNRYNEFVSNILDKDIYLLDGEKKDIYITGKDDEILYKRRDSIVLLYKYPHYELVGVLRNGSIVTLFDYTDPFIIAVRARMKQLTKQV